MEAKSDRRVLLTRKLLKDALITLMKEKPLHSISIKKTHPLVSQRIYKFFLSFFF